ncbi:hypothetical protein [Demequina capsici]|uniref:Uncharacterized protein n=1 Tax=Demequina capsici TaxID=3075620 RepID=A0AA96F5L7_9MICO|nr:hypothetical protein [Demequina sp. OYTSA14]WNM24142.1 hypothetical protein RN606_12355 [Demequina sp. OYTSA14]
MAAALFVLTIVSLICVGLVSPRWREVPMAVLAVASGVLMLEDRASDMPFTARVVMWAVVSSAYTGWQWHLRVTEVTT